MAVAQGGRLGCSPRGSKFGVACGGACHSPSRPASGGNQDIAGYLIIYYISKKGLVWKLVARYRPTSCHCSNVLKVPTVLSLDWAA